MGSWSGAIPPQTRPYPQTSGRNADRRVSSTPDDLRPRLAALTLEDEHRLRRRLDGLRRTRDPQARERQRARIADDVAVAEQRIARRRAAVPQLRHPEDLPVSERRADIAAAIRDHQVVVVAG